MKIFRALFVLCLLLFAKEGFGQHLPPSYQPMFNEIVEFYKTISSGNSVNEGKNSLRVINDERVILRIEHKKKVKNLTFVKKTDEENTKEWVAGNALTIDMVNKYEDYLTKTLKSLYDLAEKKSKE